MDSIELGVCALGVVWCCLNITELGPVQSGQGGMLALINEMFMIMTRVFFLVMQEEGGNI